jgi:hypothetical protein
MRRPKLATKITLLIVAVMIVGFGASTLWSLRREEALLVDQNKMAACRLTATSSRVARRRCSRSGPT